MFVLDDFELTDPMRYLSPRRAFVVLGAACLLTASAVWAQAEGPRVLHEYFNPWQVDVSPGTNQKADSAPGRDASPSAVAEAEQAPGLALNPGADEVVFGADGPVDIGGASRPHGPLAPAAQASRLDENTDRVDRLDYYANYDPSVMPYKRTVVQNAVRHSSGGRYELFLRRGRLRPVAVGARPAGRGEDRFWGSFLIRTSADRLHPLPSVAPHQRIVQVQVEPQVDVNFFRDGADNYYLRTSYEGLLRLNLEVAAGRHYFDGRFDPAVDWSDVDGLSAPALSEQVADVARQVLETIGVSRTMSPDQALEALIYHYRNFEGRAFPDELRGQDLYRSVSVHQIGVCRHRSLAFVISALALGVPARYLYNEAHAFVEIQWPGQGWRRIDLGGAADELNYTGPSNTDIHDGAADDPLPKPPNYLAEQRRMQQQTPGPSSGSDTPSEQGDDGSSSTRSLGESIQEALEAARDERDEQAPDPSPQSTGASEPTDAEDSRVGVHLEIRRASTEVFRDQDLGVTGLLLDTYGRPVSGRTVDVFLGPIGGRNPEARVLLGEEQTDSKGQFRAYFALPDSISIGRWELLVVFDGDEDYRGATAR